MKRSRFSEEQIIGILREQEAGVTPTADVCRKHGISEAITAARDCDAQECRHHAAPLWHCLCSVRILSADR